MSVSSNEPENGSGDGNTAHDWVIVDGHHVQLRAERSGHGTGRIYTLTVTCQDAAANVVEPGGTRARASMSGPGGAAAHSLLTPDLKVWPTLRRAAEAGDLRDSARLFMCRATPKSSGSGRSCATSKRRAG